MTAFELDTIVRGYLKHVGCAEDWQVWNGLRRPAPMSAVRSSLKRVAVARRSANKWLRLPRIGDSGPRVHFTTYSLEARS